MQMKNHIFKGDLYIEILSFNYKVHVGQDQSFHGKSVFSILLYGLNKSRT